MSSNSKLCGTSTASALTPRDAPYPSCSGVSKHLNSKPIRIDEAGRTSLAALAAQDVSSGTYLASLAAGRV
jgi:hypothetical protein